MNPARDRTDIPLVTGERSKRFVFSGVCWALAVASGFVALAQYDSVEGASGEAPTVWHDVAGLTRVEGEGLVVMAVHPRCPCTRASVVELERVIGGRGVRAVLLVATYEGVGLGAVDEAGPIVDLAERLGGFEIVEDAGGVIAASLGGLTSGSVVFYDASGRLRYRGGVTASRGHEGPSAGASMLTLALDGEADSVLQGPVYGCPLGVAPAREAGD